MLSLDDLLQALNEFLGTTETNLFTEERRINSINRAIRYVLKRYDIPAYTVKSTLQFVSGACNAPTDMLRPAKLYKTATNEYIMRDFDVFEYNLPQTYMIKFNTTTDVQQLLIYPNETTTMYFWYIQLPAALATGTDEVRFSLCWEEAIAAKACELLLRNTNSVSRKQDAKELADELIGDAWQSERSLLQGKEDQRLQSVFEKKSLLGAWNSFYDNYTTQPMFSGSMAWIETTSDATIQANYGYDVESASLVTLTLPTQASVGDTFAVLRSSTGNWRIAQNSGQSITFGNVTTTVGTGGYLESTALGDSVQIVCVEENTGWFVTPGAVGNITYV